MTGPWQAPSPPVTVAPLPAGLPALPAGSGGPTTILPPRQTDAAGTPLGPRRARRQERRRRRRRVRIAALAVLVLLATIAGTLTALHGHVRQHPVAGPARTQSTLLLGIGAQGSPAQSVALFGVDPGAKTGGTLLIPPDTLVDGPGDTVGGSFPISEQAEFPGAVSDLLGVHVDATWRLSPTGLAALVQQLGGITVDVDTPISAPALNLVAGPQTLTGQQAAAYALYDADTEQAMANRTRLVFDAILAKLPPQTGLTALLGSLGPNSQTSETSAQLATFLLALGASDDADNEDVLPTTTLDAGGSAPASKVVVINDSGRPDLATGARTKLTAAGLTFVRAVNDEPFHQYARSAILVFNDAPATIAFGHRVAAALGLPAAPVLVSSQTSSVADALAVLADDYGG
jgi:anionic cell wall polymer biosynthesis LytR-Cps2A-Psr (LCP) family protein